MADVTSPPVLRERNATPEEKKMKETPERTPLMLAPSPVRCRKLEPSLQAWSASRTCAAQPNVARSERGRAEERYARHDWPESLREKVAESKQFWGKEFQPTVPQGPRLRTEERSRSRSCSSSRSCTPQGTPNRRSQSRSMTPGRGMPAKEQVAVEQYLSRMSLARLDSPLRKLAFGSSLERGVAPSPARSHTSSRTSDSRDSRLSQLSRPRSLSKDHLSTEDRQCLRAAEERRALRRQLRRNRRIYKEALIGGSVTERCTDRTLTQPMAPELMTSQRSSRLRSCSWHGDQNERVFLKKHPNPREQAAIERHLEQRFNALNTFKELPVVSRKCKELQIPQGVDHSEWLQQAETTEERAERARAVALAKRDSEWEQQRSKLCVFRPSTGGAPQTPKKETEEVDDQA